MTLFKPCLIILLFFSLPAFSQEQRTEQSHDTTNVSFVDNAEETAGKFPDRLFKKITKAQNKAAAKIDKQNKKALARMKKREEKLYASMRPLDSTKAKKMFASAMAKYNALEKRVNSPVDSLIENGRGKYIPRMDSLKNMIGFLNNNGSTGRANKEVSEALSSVENLKNKYVQSSDINSLLEERKASIKATILKLGTDNLKQLPALQKAYGSYGKEVHYYKERLANWKKELNNPEKLEKDALALLKHVPAFKKYMASNGEMTQLFGQSGGSAGRGGNTGLQTRTNTSQQLVQRFGKEFLKDFTGQGGALEQAQGELAKQKAGLSQWENKYKQAKAKYDEANEKIKQLKDTSQGTLKARVKDSITTAAKALRDKLENQLALLDCQFEPNQQKTKPLKARLEKGWNLQTGDKKGNFPASNNLAIHLGVKISDRFIAGVGVAYKFGLGSGLKDIRYTHDGLGLRTYVDWKLNSIYKTSPQLFRNFWISGGYELNYFAQFKNVADLKKVIWQRSGLTGITKKIKLPGYDKKKMSFQAKEMKISAMWDFLSYREHPQGRAFVVRVGYNF